MVEDRAGRWWGWLRLGGAVGRTGPGAAASVFGGLPRPDPPSEEVLSAADRDTVQHILDVLCASGVLAGPSPDPAYLYPGVVEEGLPVRVEGVLATVWEAAVLYADMRLEDYTHNLVRHDFQVEQFADALEKQVADLARLTTGMLRVVVERIEQTTTADGLRTRVWMRIDGVLRVLDYLGHPKRLSTVIHVEVARALRACGSSRRMAWLWSDQGQWITTLAMDVEQLNAELGIGPDAPDCFSWWEWVDEATPLAAGDTTG
jgi:hypothetical protein